MCGRNYSGDDYPNGHFTGNAMIWPNGDSSQSALAGDLCFWNSATGNYMQLSGYNAAYASVWSVSGMCYDWEYYGDANEFSLVSSRWPLYVYTAKNTDPTDTEGLDATVWPWHVGYWNFDPETPDEFIPTQSGTAICIYWGGGSTPTISSSTPPPAPSSTSNPPSSPATPPAPSSTSNPPPDPQGDLDLEMRRNIALTCGNYPVAGAAPASTAAEARHDSLLKS